jgi:isopenicillin-N epimerase
MNDLKAEFLLDPEVVFLNHGSFGATPARVFSVYQEWQRRLENQPVQFMINELMPRLAEARLSLGKYINVKPEDVVYIPNATYGLNVVARSLDLGPEDEVLTTDHEYGACDNIWRFLSQKRRYRYRHQSIPLPIDSLEEAAERLWQAVSPRTKVIYLSHITSPTATRFPVETICRRARESGILTVIDGAHAPGQIPLDMERIGADFYFGNAHKWMCAPKGAGFLYAKRDKQSLVEPLVVSWGWSRGGEFSAGSTYLDYLQWTGTNDPAAYLSVPAAIQFQADHDWPAVRQRCHNLARQAMRQICEMTGLAPIYPYQSAQYHQMVTVPLPPIADLPALKSAIYERFRVEVPLIDWGDRSFIRISVQGYNNQQDIEALLVALSATVTKG